MTEWLGRAARRSIMTDPIHISRSPVPLVVPPRESITWHAVRGQARYQAWSIGERWATRHDGCQVMTWYMGSHVGADVSHYKRCHSPAMRVPGVRRSERFPCCRSHFRAWCITSPCESMARGVAPTGAASFWTHGHDSTLAPMLEVEFTAGPRAVEVVQVSGDMLDVLVDAMRQRGIVTDDIAYLMRIGAWTSHHLAGGMSHMLNALPSTDVDVLVAATVCAMLRDQADGEHALTHALASWGLDHGHVAMTFAGMGWPRWPAPRVNMAALDHLLRIIAACARRGISTELLVEALQRTRNAHLVAGRQANEAVAPLPFWQRAKDVIDSVIADRAEMEQAFGA